MDPHSLCAARRAASQARVPARAKRRQRSGPRPNDREALLRVAAAVAGAHTLDEVLELAAEEALRGDRGGVALGQPLGPRARRAAHADQRRRARARGRSASRRTRRYAIADHPQLQRMLRNGEPYFNAVDDPACDPKAVAVLRSLGQGVRRGRADRDRGRVLGRGLGEHRHRPAALPRLRRAVPPGDRGPARGGDRARRAVLPRLAPGLRGPAHRPLQPPGGRGAPRAGRQPRRTAGGQADAAPVRRRQPQGRSTTSAATRPATGR